MMKEIILNHRAERDQFLSANYIQREGISKARKNMQNDLIKVVVGPRRAGKSIFALQMLENLDFAYLNFDDERLVGLADYDDLTKAIKQVYGETKNILFDEIQNLSNWEIFLNRLQRRGYNIVITGSNSRLLSTELATHLTGRYIQFPLYPFSFTEYLTLLRLSVRIEDYESKEQQGAILRRLDDYLQKGGYPEVLTKDIEPRNYLGTLYESILFKDIVKRFNVRYAKKLYDLGLFCITNHANEISYTKLKNALGFNSVHTVVNYTGYLSEAFLIFYIKRFSHKVKEQMKSPQKVYAYDTGMINAVKFRTSPDFGRLIENLAAIELARREKEFYCYHARDNKEVDFLIKEGLGVAQLIQVCYDNDQDKTKKREVASLLKAADETGCNNLLVLTWDYEENESMIGKKKISYLPLWKWIISGTV